MFQLGEKLGGSSDTTRGPSVSPLIEPNEVIIGDRSYKIDTEKLVENIKAGIVDGVTLYPILTAPGVLKGTEINQILLDFAAMDEPGAMPGKSFAPEGMSLQQRVDSGFYSPGDFGSTAQNIGLEGLRALESLRNIGIGAANLGIDAANVGLGAFDVARDYFTGPKVQEFIGGARRAEEALKPESVAARADPGFRFKEKFDFIPLTQPKDVAEMRINQLGSMLLASGEIDDDLRELLKKSFEQEEKPDVVDTAKVTEIPEELEEELPKGIVEIRNIDPDSYEDSTIRRLQYERDMITRDDLGRPLPDTQLLRSREIQQVLDEIRPAEVKVDVDKTEIESLADIEEKFEGMSEDEISEEIKKEKKEFLDENIDLTVPKPKLDVPLLTDEDLPEGEITIEDIRSQDPAVRNRAEGVAIDKKIEDPGFFGTNRFLDFIRNTGLGLEEKGQLGPGLAAGAAKAAKERAARDLLEFQENLKFDRNLRLERAKAKLEGLGGPSDSMKKELRKVGQEMNADYNDIVSAKNTLEIVGRVREIVNNEDTSSVKAFLDEALEKGKEFFDIDGKPTDDPSKGTSFDKLTSRTRAKVLLNQIKQKNIRDILGESGKTISNLDRQIVEQLVGDISLGATQAETLEALRITEQSIFNNLDKAQKRLKTNFFFAENENGLYLIPDVETILSYLQSGTLPVTEYNKGYESSSIKKITL